ncbi:hypothetical protein C4572_03070 [Candidatus Parcubacteria bacterium]|nr:MAG: hypothetical protein C4572_03070 [Candidatus Parcubacteria bacterium]
MSGVVGCNAARPACLDEIISGGGGCLRVKRKKIRDKCHNETNRNNSEEKMMFFFFQKKKIVELAKNIPHFYLS